MVEIAYTRTGSGVPVVLVHGIGHRREAWNPIVPELSQHHEVIALDLPGFGRSPALPPDVPYDMGTTMTNLATFFADLGIDRPHVVGDSLGGAIALELAVRDLVRTATAFSPAGFWTAASREYAFTMLRLLRGAAKLPAPVVRYIGDHPRLRALAMSSLFAHPERLSEDAFLGDAFSMRDAPGFEPTLRAGASYHFTGRPVVPTTIAWGNKDHILLPGQARRAGRLVPGALHVRLPDCGHVPMIDAPKLINRVILERTRGDQSAG